MIGIVIAAHSNMAQGLVNAAEMILGSLTRVEALSVGREDGPDDIRQRFSVALDRVNVDGEGVLILTDMFGGTPSNIGLSFMASARVEVVAGVNLPMLLKACNARCGLSIEDLAVEVKDYAEQSVVWVSQLIKERGLSR
ncbi:MAG: PTS sugar transporter subunit IIA [Syntrophotaleaceae bacterium]